MKFDDLDKRMRVYETSADLCVLPNLYIVARLDGRGFTRLTKQQHRFEAPFDVRFHDMMVATTDELLQHSGLRIRYGYTQSDEISLLVELDEQLFARKLRKLNSVLAGLASARFSLELGDIAVFDCRISQLPTRSLVCDYFCWRSEDAARNSLSAHAYWALRKSGLNEREATSRLEGMAASGKHELLYAHGINFNDLPAWQKRGVALYWESYEKQAVNQKTGEQVVATRRRVARDKALPPKDKYRDYIDQLLQKDVHA